MDYERERYEAYQAGNRALNSLLDAKNYLAQARTWGVLDLFGGRGLSSVIKHMKITNARSSMERAKYDLMSFSRELSDISVNLNVNISDLLTVFDIFDSFLADVIVQSRIADAQRKIDCAIDEVRHVLSTLRLQ